MASSIKDLANRKTRDGIYDINLNRVGD
ncbi:MULTISPECIES: toxin C-terminal domain-containing protein [Terrisporobacter]|nr:toxin C-terminal domain-containing protein [Terrisporobacter mayombei]